LSELDAEWKQLLAEAERRARRAGRVDVGEYLALRQSNDEARRAGIEWLFETFTRLAGEANRAQAAALSIERDDAYRFRVGASTMVGTQVTLRAGEVRALRIAAGWPRAPKDGIVRGGLARAEINHFGAPKRTELLLLERAQEELKWIIIVENTNARREFLEESARHHITMLLA
jgi:hypothetical protein